MNKYNWNDMKSKYETCNYTYKDLAEIYNGNESYIARIAHKENWEKYKSKEKVQKGAD